jgi:glycosyltransferase involved in cell wall biosynthesis
MPKLVSIIIPAYNAEKFIARTIYSALGQTYQTKEIIVVDDGSTDRTCGIAREFEKYGVRVFTQANKGAAAARNKGFDESTGEYIQYLDADDLLAPSKIEEQMRVVEKQGDKFAYAGKWKVFYDDVNEKIDFVRNDLWRDFDNPVDWLTVAWTNRVWMHPGVWLTSRSLIEEAGRWNESLSLHDDGEFFCRILLRSKGVFFCEKSVSYYRKGIDNSLSSLFSTKAIQSHFKICELYEQHLLTQEDSTLTRRACATNYLSFYYDHFPGNTGIRKQALMASVRLGGAEVRPSGTDFFYLLRPIFGWRISKRIERFYYDNGLNWGAIKRRWKT